jgi:ribosome-associated translation inhibitor RaiA
MEIPVQITFHGMSSSSALDALVHEQADKLERLNERITRCEVAIEVPHRQHRKGTQVHVRITLTVPGKEIVVSRDPGPEDGHGQAEVAVRDAFAAARRQLEEHAQARADAKRRGTPADDGALSPPPPAHRQG